MAISQRSTCRGHYRGHRYVYVGGVARERRLFADQRRASFAGLEAMGLAIFFVAVVILLYRGHHTQVLTETKEQEQLSLAPAARGATSPTIERYIDREHSFLFLDPPKRELWKAQIRFAQGGDKLKIRLDYSAHSGGLGEGFWSEPRHLLLRQQNTFAKGQDITIDLMALDDSEPRHFGAGQWKMMANRWSHQPCITAD